MDHFRTGYRRLEELYRSPHFQVDITDADAGQKLSYFITDMYNGVDDVEKVPGQSRKRQKRKDSFIGFMHNLMGTDDFSCWWVLIIIGVLTSFTGIMLDYIINGSYNLRLYLSFISSDDSTIWSFFKFYLSGFVMVSLSAGMGAWFTPFVDGSGIPELRSILSGANTFKYLDKKIFWPKIFGLACAYGGGMALGKTGPLVHLSCIIANYLLKFERFKHLDKNYAMKRSILSGAVCAGVTAGMSAPVAGVIFGVELHYGQYNAKSLIRCIVCAVWASIPTKLIGTYIKIDELNRINYDHYVLHWDLFTFVLVGLLVGLMIVFVLKIAAKLTYLRRNFNLKIFQRFPYIWIGYTLIVILTFPFPYALQTTRVFYNDTFTSESLLKNPKYVEGPIWTMLHIVIIQSISAIVTYSSNIPFGIFGPASVIGAMIGRTIAELGDRLGIFVPQNKGAYAVAGTAAGICCVAQTLSPVSMFPEMTGQMEFAMPIAVTVVCSYLVGNIFAMSFFDVAIYLRKLPIITSIMGEEQYEKTARDIMSTTYAWLSDEADHRDAFNLFMITEEINKAMSIPILSPDGALLGSVKNEYLLEYMEHIHKTQTLDLIRIINEKRNTKEGKSARIEKLERFFSKTRSINEMEIHNEGDSRVVRHSFQMKTFNAPREFAENDPVEEFWNSRINWEHPKLRFDPSPLMVNADCYVSKVQYLFSTTKATAIYVVNKGKLIGVITSPAFIKFKN